MKQLAPLVSLTDSEVPFGLPQAWCWVRLGDVTNYGACEKASGLAGETWVLDLEDVEKDTGRIVQWKTVLERRSQSDKNVFRSGDVLYGKLRPYLNKVALADRNGVCTTEILPLRPFTGVSARYVQIALQSPYFLEYVNSKSYGMKMPRLGTDDGRSAPFPLPPLAEQHRIVARVEVLMKLCDALEQSGRLADEQHARLTTTLFDALAASESAHALAENWQRIAEHFDLLLDRPEAIDALEQTILQLAVRGLLVQQEVHEALATNVPASIRDADSLSNEAEEANADLPTSWRRVLLGSITRDLRYGTSAKCGYEAEGAPVLRIPNLYRGRVRVSDLKFGALSADEIERLRLEVGDLLIIRSNGSASLVGSAAVVGEEAKGFAFAGYLMRLRLREELAIPSYVLLTLETADVRSQIEGPLRTTSGVKNVNSTEIGNISLTLPPLAEQHRIVARVEELRRLCAQLRERLTEVRRTQSQLADALVAQAVA